MGGLSWWHWIIILGAFVLLFGAKKLPDAARGVGRSLRILKSEVSAMSDDDKARTEETAEVAPVGLTAPTPVVPAVALAGCCASRRPGHRRCRPGQQCAGRPQLTCGARPRTSRPGAPHSEGRERDGGVT